MPRSSRIVSATTQRLLMRQRRLSQTQKHETTLHPMKPAEDKPSQMAS